jgi:hypothetical protein
VEATTILAIVLGLVFFGGMAGLLIYMNTTPKDRGKGPGADGPAGGTEPGGRG